jgi:hypothetical protein
LAQSNLSILLLSQASSLAYHLRAKELNSSFKKKEKSYSIYGKHESIYLFRPTIESDIKSSHGKDTDQDGIQLPMYGKEGGLKATYPRLGTYETLSNKNPMEPEVTRKEKV